MHPIEKAHKMIVAGNVLSDDGKWVPRNEALKRKRSLVQHVLKGEVEQDGKWVKITDVDAKPVVNPITLPESILSEPVSKNSFVDKNPFRVDAEELLPENNASSTSEQEDKLQKQSLPIDVPPKPVVEEPRPETLPPQPVLVKPPKQLPPEESPQRETITIRTIPLGKETTLTISESRAGSALVAICSIQGFLDQTNADDFQSQLMSMLDFGVLYFVIDMEHTTLVGSAGWGTIAVAARLIKAAKGRLLICAMKEEIEESFFLLQFNEVIDARKTITDSLSVISDIIKSGNSDVEIPPADDTYSPFGEAYDDLPLPEKIKTIIAQNGSLSFFEIHSLLKQERYGKEKINPFKLYFILRDLNLDTRWKRSRFYRSC